jgi:tetratricopeptide (TPR) repeat protein
MSTLCTKGLLHACLVIGGLACLAFAASQQRYTRMVAVGDQAVAAHRFDTRAYERASHFWFANQDALLFNQGVLAYKARNLPRAAESFRQVSQRTTSPTLQMQAYYNLGMVMLALEDGAHAAECFKQALRLDPHDAATKFNLERLYHIVLRQEGGYGEAGLKQAPGAGQEEGKGQSGDGHGRSTPGAGI